MSAEKKYEEVKFLSFKDLNIARTTGEVVNGIFTGTFRKAMYTKAGEPFLSISHGFESQDGSTLTLVNNVKALEDGLAKLGPQIGDSISISYDGMVPKKNKKGVSNNVHSVKVRKA